MWRYMRVGGGQRSVYTMHNTTIVSLFSKNRVFMAIEGISKPYLT